MADPECVRLLSILHKQLGPEQFEQAKLFLQCIGLGGEELDSARDLLDLQRIVSSDRKFSEALAIAIMKFILMEIGVADAEGLIATSDNIQKAENLLVFPTLLIKLCKRLGHDDYLRFKGCICNAVLNHNPTCIKSRVDLMKKLLHQTAISPGNVDVLIEWLSVAGRNDLTKIVEEYKVKSLQQSTQPNSNGYQPTEEKEAGNSFDMNRRVRLIADKIGVSDKDLDRRVLENDLELIAKLIPEHWDQFVGLSADASSSLSALCDWYGREAGNATYRVLIEDFVSKNRVRIAEQVCRMAKVAHFCPSSQPQHRPVTTVPIPVGAHKGVAPEENLWDPSLKELKVFFMNADVLRAPKRRWLCGDNCLEQMNTGNILEWATRGWKSDHPMYPQISSTPARKIEESHIRVWFAETTTVGNAPCWSYVGKDAQYYPTERTMVLDLFNLHQQVQQSLVIHEFGHALGMVHEHQRSDFWDVLDGLVKDQLPGADNEHRRFTPSIECGDHPYDPDSIMHYWFDKGWLKEEFQVDDLKDVDTIPNLSLEQKKVIRGVHIRDYQNGRLAKEPSTGDFKTLNDEYTKLALKQAS